MTMKLPVFHLIVWGMLFGSGVMLGTSVAPHFNSQSVNSAQLVTPPPLADSSRVSGPNNNETNSSAAYTRLAEGFEQRLLAQLNSVVQNAVQEALSKHNTPATSNHITAPLKAASAPLTEAQQQAFENIRVRLEDSVKSQTITWQQLVTSPELAQLPLASRKKILGLATDMLNRGELSPDQFIHGK